MGPTSEHSTPILDSYVWASFSFLQQVVNNIRIFRIFRSLKTVTRIEKVRLLVSAIINAFTAMVFITILLGVFLYIFAIFGVIVFRGPTDELEGEVTGSWNRFGNMWAAMATLFQIFTLDNWLNIAKQTAQTGGGWLTYFYVILWILIGSFIFNNIFVGIMVNNFQNIRNELFREVSLFKKIALGASTHPTTKRIWFRLIRAGPCLSWSIMNALLIWFHFDRHLNNSWPLLIDYYLWWCGKNTLHHCIQGTKTVALGEWRLIGIRFGLNLFFLVFSVNISQQS